MVFLMGLLYIAAGVNHFIHPEFYIKMIPFLPYPIQINFLSGIVEVLVGLTVMIPAFRIKAARGIIALLVAVFPANIYMALHWAEWGNSPYPLFLRLPIQALLIWWAYLYTKPSKKH